MAETSDYDLMRPEEPPEWEGPQATRWRSGPRIVVSGAGTRRSQSLRTSGGATDNLRHRS